ncbi:MAG: hypothetical protein Q8P81_04375 [Nanoarchaeota archaeon]|nr:hypothetical protein [Nanoarchaeota archaeon]
MRASEPRFSHASITIGDVSQDYNIFRNDKIFITTSLDLQEAHRFEIYFSKSSYYKISWVCIWDSKLSKEDNIEVRVLFDNTQEFLYEKINEILSGVSLIFVEEGNHIVSFDIKTNLEGEEVRLNKSRLEISRVF